MPGKYDGVHSFLFLYDGDDPDPETVIAKLRQIVDPERGPVFFASLFDGDFRGFAHLAETSLERLGDLLDEDLWERGVRSDHDVESRFYISGTRMMGPKRGSPRYCAICRVKTTQRPSVVMGAIGEHFDEEAPFIGASTVIGRYKVVVELGAEDPGDLQNAIEELGTIEGVGPREVAVADLGEMNV